MEWLFVDTGAKDGEFNMKFDLLLADLFEQNKISPVLRVYQWKPYAISIGYNQDESVFDKEKLKAYGLGFVRRPTGGRAVLHAEELTYSVVLPCNGRKTLEIYNLIGRAIVEGLKKIGIEVELERAQPDFRDFYKEVRSVPCFASSGRYEVQFKGKKVVGSAQRRFKNAVLQHGSILIGNYHKKIIDFIKLKNTEALKFELDKKTTCLNEIAGRKVSFDEVSSALKYGFGKVFGVSFKDVDEKIFLGLI